MTLPPPEQLSAELTTDDRSFENSARERRCSRWAGYATFFEAPTGAHLEPITHQPGDIITNYDSDPFHYSLDEIRAMAEIARMNVEYIGDWGHPRDQKMLCFAPAT